MSHTHTHTHTHTQSNGMGFKNYKIRSPEDATVFGSTKIKEHTFKKFPSTLLNL